jgi:hypothetical protein
LPGRDLYPDRCRSLSDRTLHIRYEQGTTITMSIVAHSHPFVIGVDAHARNHALAILACPAGELIDESQFPQRPQGCNAHRMGRSPHGR